MYRAKAKGRGCYEIFAPSLREEIITTSQMENDLQHAIERNELLVYYQPIVSLATRQIVGFEALLHWEHPQRGLILPTEFIALAEKSQLIMALNWWVLQKACNQIKIWQAQGKFDSSLSINVDFSSKQFLRANLIEEIKNLLEATGLKPHNLGLEITESTIIKNPELARTVLTKLQQLGINISLDGFGTGYSSLSYLHSFPVNFIKIDRSFIGKLNQDSKSLEVVRAILALCKNLELKVIAEGIETEEHFNILQQLQCHYGQGYLFASPQKYPQ